MSASPFQTGLLAKFVSDPHAKALLVDRVGGKDEGAEGGDDDDAAKDEAEQEEELEIQYSISLNVAFSHPRMTSLAFVKRGATLEAEKPLGQQLRLITLREGTGRRRQNKQELSGDSIVLTALYALWYGNVCLN